MTTHTSGEPQPRGEQERRQTTPLELFLDLAFTAAVAGLSAHLVHHPTGRNVAIFAGLFVAVWWLWVVQTFAADRLDDDSLPHRVVVLAGAVAVAVLAAAATDVPGHGDTLFVTAYLAGRAIPAVLYLRASARRGHLRRITLSFCTGSLLAAPLWIGGLLVANGYARVALWAGALLVELALPFLNSKAVAAAPRSPSHLSERYDLFTIIVLGQSLIGPTTALDEAPDTLRVVLAAVLAIGITGCLWWAYFGFRVPQPAFTGGFAQLQVFSLGYIPLTLAVAATGTGGALLVEQTLHRPDAPLPPVARLCLYGGAFLFLAAQATIRVTFTGPDRTVRVRVAAAVILSVVAARLNAPVGAAILLAALMVCLTLERYPIRMPARFAGTS
ncbi:low temperature requirement protein A [Actinopolymorpha pittospori]|uniref:Low temperature requirement protein LtrA n=1 Tax=Actinopolymorpha pittospori TaxID=648752 RepID=A0A927MTR1_9ACTN|nr:low temperature requirement protein LtrA [Actinopolymorpha pittospori]